MKRIFTYSIAISLLFVISNKTSAQCLVGGSFTAGSTNTFSTTAEGFAGDFAWTATSSGQLESTPVSAGPSKVLTSTTLFLPANATTVAWSFNLAGTANVTSYTVEALYSVSGVINSVDVCSGGSLTTTGSNLVFAAVAPSQIIGSSFKLKITFTSSSTGNKVLTVDNFKSNASAAAAALPVTITYFSASAAPGAILLTWLVASESNVSRYEIERSANGKTFSKIGSVAASGLVTYKYSDAAYSTGSNYYRLKAVDNDGKYKYSSITLFKVGKNGLSLTTTTSLITSEVTVLHTEATSTSEIDVTSMDGKLVKKIKPAIGNSKTSIDLSNTRPGLYLISYTTGNGEAATVKVVKQ